jgi:hypothetical protein
VGLWQPLSALDLLSVNNLINYFGKSEETNNIEVPPHPSSAYRSEGYLSGSRFVRPGDQLPV